MADRLLPTDLVFEGSFPRLSRRLRIGIVGGGRIAVTQAMASFPMVRQAREMVRNGAIGKVNQIHVEFMQDWMIPDDIAEADHVKWRLDPAKAGSTSCTGDIGTHAHHIASFVSGLEMTHLRAEM